MTTYNFKSLLFLAGLIVFLASCERELSENSALIQEEAELSTAISERLCGMESHMGKLLEDPTYARNHLAKFDRLKTVITNRADCPNKVIIPVAVHFQRARNVDIACLRQQAIDQIQILNDDYGGTNSDINLWSSDAASLFPGISNGETCIEFCIATRNHPAGYGLSEGDLAVTLNETRGDSDRNWAGYLNIFVRPIQYLGYSPLGGSGDGDGVVIDDDAFSSLTLSGCSGTSPNAPYNLGRTLTHELGHYLLLDHIWGGGCSRDDGVNDTPESNGPYYGCPTNGAATCGSTDMHMNYMDYVDDRCMYMFSAGQSTVMEGYVASSLAVLSNNAANVCGDPEPPTGDCTIPTGLSSNVNKKKVNLSWDSQTGATFDVRYKLTSSSNWTTISTSGSSTQLNGVKSGSYEFQVRAKCGENTAWSASSFFQV